MATKTKWQALLEKHHSIAYMRDEHGDGYLMESPCEDGEWTVLLEHPTLPEARGFLRGYAAAKKTGDANPPTGA